MSPQANASLQRRLNCNTNLNEIISLRTTQMPRIGSITINLLLAFNKVIVETELHEPQGQMLLWWLGIKNYPFICCLATHCLHHTTSALVTCFTSFSLCSYSYVYMYIFVWDSLSIYDISKF